MSFPRYPSYRDSGVALLGEVPSHWRVSRVRDLAQIVNGYPFDSSLFDPAEGQPLLRIRDLGRRETEVRTSEAHPKQVEVSGNDVLIGMDGDFNVGRWLGEENALLNQRVCALRVKMDTLSKLLEYALPGPLKTINELTYSTTVKHLASSDVGAIRLALPNDASELQTLIDFLDRETAKIDALVEAQRRLIALLKEKRQAVIFQTVTKGLDPSAPLKPSGVEWLGDVPAHWAILRLKYIADFVPGKAHEPYIDDDGSHIYVSARFVSTQGASERLCSENLTPANIDDILMVMSDLPNGRALAKAFLVKDDRSYAVNQRVCIIRSRGMDPVYLCFQLDRSIGLLRNDDGMNQTHLSNSDFNDLAIIVPSTDEQSRIAAHLVQATSEFERLSAAAESAMALLTERRAALISAAVTGKIDVRGLGAAPETAAAA